MSRSSILVVGFFAAGKEFVGVFYWPTVLFGHFLNGDLVFHPVATNIAHQAFERHGGSLQCRYLSEIDFPHCAWTAGAVFYSCARRFLSSFLFRLVCFLFITQFATPIGPRRIFDGIKVVHWSPLLDSLRSRQELSADAKNVFPAAS
jgi:hypothetical protein